MNESLSKAMQCPDDLVVEFTYCDAKGQRTRRVVSPIRFLGKGRFLGLCLAREQPRQFHLGRCDQMQVQPAHKYLMPVPMVALPSSN